MNLGWRKQMKYVGKGSKMWLMWWLVYQGVYIKHISNGSHQKYTSDRIHKFNKRLQASAGTLFTLWQWDLRQPSSSTVHRRAAIAPNSKPSCQSLLRIVFMVCWHRGMASSHWGWAFTSRWVHKSTQWYALWPYVGIESPLPSAKKQRVTHAVRSQKEQSGREKGDRGSTLLATVYW